MKFHDYEQIEDLGAKALKKYTVALIEELYKHKNEIAELDEESLINLYQGLVEGLDSVDGIDGLGTEGWRYTFL